MFHAKFKVLARLRQGCQNFFLSVYLLKENHAGKYDLGLLTFSCSYAVENIKNLFTRNKPAVRHKNEIVDRKTKLDSQI